MSSPTFLSQFITCVNNVEETNHAILSNMIAFINRGKPEKIDRHAFAMAKSALEHKLSSFDDKSYASQLMA